MAFAAPYAAPDSPSVSALYGDIRAISDPIHNALRRINKNGSFAAFGSLFPASLVDPGCAVEGVGTIDFPLTSLQAQRLTQESQRASFGQGDNTIIDDRLRDTWEVDAARVSFTAGWQPCLDEAVKKVKVEMGLGPDLKEVAS